MSMPSSGNSDKLPVNLFALQISTNVCVGTGLLPIYDILVDTKFRV